MHNKWLKLALAVMMIVILVSGCNGGTTQQDNTGNQQNAKIKVGFMYMGDLTDVGWVQAQETGRKYLQEQMPDVETVAVDKVAPGKDAQAALEQLIADGCKVVFSTSYEHEADVQLVAARHPEIVFMQCAGTKTAANIGTYFGYMEQCNYLAGMLAGLMTRSNQVGYVAPVAVPEVFRDINAFALGVQSVNSQAEVVAAFTLSWYDQHRENQIAGALIELNCDVLAHDVGTDATDRAAEKDGLYSIGYNVDLRPSAPKGNLTSLMWDWGPYYVDTVKKVQAGSWTPEAYIGGLDSGMVKMAPLADFIPAEVRQKYENAQQKMLGGQQKIFTGPITDNKGNLRVPAGQEASPEELAAMDWLVKGVVTPIKYY